MFDRLIHKLFPQSTHRCIEHMKWQYPNARNQTKYKGIKAELVCEMCGREIAFKWFENNYKRIFIHTPFRKYKEQLENLLFDEMRL